MAEEQKPSGKPPKGELAIFKGEPCSLLLPPEWTANPQQGAFRTSLSKQSKQGRKLIMQALDGQVPSIESKVNLPLDVIGITVHPVQFEDDDTGELITAIRTVLHCENGESFGCVSTGVLKSLSIIEGLFGAPPWPKAMRMIPRRAATGEGRSRYLLELVDD